MYQNKEHVFQSLTISWVTLSDFAHWKNVPL